MFKNIYKNKRVLITGHTGFKGSWMAEWLNLLGAKVYGISLRPSTTPSHHYILESRKKIKNYYFSILDSKRLEKKIQEIKPNFVFHLAAQAIVKTSYKNPKETWMTNLIGSINILECLKKINNNCYVVMVTSDKCYENVEQMWGYKESDLLGGKDPYSASKASTEIAIRSYVNSFYNNKNSNIRIASARAGNVIGGGDWSNDRIIPDCVKAWSSNRKVILRQPNSTRPWQHVLEPISGYLTLGLMLVKDKKLNGESFNFGPYHPISYSVGDLVKEMKIHWKDVKYQIKRQKNLEFESGLLKLNCDKAANLLGWFSVLDFNETVEFTSSWYKKYYDKENVNHITQNDINKYSKFAKLKKLYWAK